MSHLPTNFRSHQTSTPYKIQKRDIILILSTWFLLILVDIPSPAIPGSPAMCHSEVRLRWPVATTKMDQAGDKSCLNSPDPWRQGIDGIDEIFFWNWKFQLVITIILLKREPGWKTAAMFQESPAQEPMRCRLKHLRPHNVITVYHILLRTSSNFKFNIIRGSHQTIRVRIKAQFPSININHSHFGVKCSVLIMNDSQSDRKSVV